MTSEPTKISIDAAESDTPSMMGSIESLTGLSPRQNSKKARHGEHRGRKHVAVQR
jgi:hypothetical protein